MWKNLGVWLLRNVVTQLIEEFAKKAEKEGASK
jgi:hypothetical protein